MRRHGGPTKRARRRGTMCPSSHQGGTDRGCTLQPSPDLAPVQKRLRTFSAQFHDLRPVRAQIPAAWRRTLRIMVRIVRQGKEIARYWDLWEKLGSAPTLFKPNARRRKCTNNMKMSHDTSNMQTMPLSPSPSHCMALMLGKWCWKIVAAITASAMGGLLMIH